MCCVTPKPGLEILFKCITSPFKTIPVESQNVDSKKRLNWFYLHFYVHTYKNPLVYFFGCQCVQLCLFCSTVCGSLTPMAQLGGVKPLVGDTHLTQRQSWQPKTSIVQNGAYDRSISESLILLFCKNQHGSTNLFAEPQPADGKLPTLDHQVAHSPSRGRAGWQRWGRRRRRLAPFFSLCAPILCGVKRLRSG